MAGFTQLEGKLEAEPILRRATKHGLPQRQLCACVDCLIASLFFEGSYASLRLEYGMPLG